MNIFLKFVDKCKEFKIKDLPKIQNISFFKPKRCDHQSKCAECSRKLLAILRHYHSTYSWYKLNDNHDKSQEYLDILMALLDLKYDSKIPPSIHAHTDLSGVAKNEYIIQERYLSQHKCNKLALMILNEALLQFQDSLKYSKFDINDESVDSYILESIEYLKTLVTSKEYSPTTNIDFLNEKLRIYTYKFEGNGMKYLSELSKSKTMIYS